MASDDDLRAEYSLEDLGEGVRGKYYKSVQAGTNLVLLDADVAAAFPDPKMVNDTLRALISIAQNTNLSSNNEAN